MSKTHGRAFTLGEYRTQEGPRGRQRGRLWSKLSRAIMVAARHGGGDTESNLKLGYAIDKASEVSMPTDDIERAIKKGAGESAGEALEDVSYEGYALGGVAVLVDILTDNRNRTAGEVRKGPRRCGRGNRPARSQLIEALDDHDDVQGVSSNLNVTEAMTAGI